ncbi:sugar ABC transporter substrate-binding protein [Deinococcus aetherius]|uniref:ABC transporter substrate-binding protein n=1 Tax=Deinococcus aetherius TaxID=200252 RepID=UPI0031EEA5D7
MNKVLSRAALLAATCALSAAPLTAGAQGSPKVITFWTAEMASYEPLMNGLIKQFETQNPGVQIKWVDVPFGEVQTRLVQAVAAGREPDVVNLSYEWTHRFAAEGALVPLQKYLSKQDLASYLPNILSAMRYGNDVGALPYLTTEVVLWNKDIFRQAGLDPNKGPTSDADLLRMGRQIKAKTGKYAFMPTGTILGNPYNFFRSYNIPLLSADGKRAAFNTPRAVAALKFWKAAYDQGLMPEETPSAEFKEEVTRFGAGDLAIAITGPWFVGSQLIPNGFDIGKLGIGAYYGIPNAATMDVAVMSGSKYPAEAAKWARFVTSDTAMLAHARFTNGTELPGTTQALRSNFFKQPETSAKTAALNQAYTTLKRISASQMLRARISPPKISTERYDELTTALKDAVKASLLGQKDPQKALADAQATWNKVLAAR